MKTEDGEYVIAAVEDFRRLIDLDEYLLMVQGTVQSPNGRCLAVAPIFYSRVTRILTQPKRHRYAQECILRFARDLVIG